MMRKFSAFILVLIFAVSFVSSAQAADITLSSAVVINSSNQSEYNGKSVGGTIPASSSAGAIGTFISQGAIVVDGIELNLTIDGFNTDYSEKNFMCSGISLVNGAKLHLTVNGTNTLKAGYGGAGIAVPAGCTLEITSSSTGTLNATGGKNYGGGAGIGSIGNRNNTNTVHADVYPQGLGDITINGGTINAQGGTWYNYTTATGGAAGIGSSGYSGVSDNGVYGDKTYVNNITGSVTITDGTVNATGGFGASGIGGGHTGTLKSIKITGGTVTATGTNNAAAIGLGHNGLTSGNVNSQSLTCPSIELTGGNITANGNIGYGYGHDNGILNVGGSVTIGSNVTLNCSGTIAPFAAANLPSNSYVDQDGKLNQAQNVSSALNQTSLTEGWWVVDKDMTANSRIDVQGEVNLILNEGFTLTADKGIHVGKGNTLNIYAQMNGTGKITASSSGTTFAAIGGGFNGQDNSNSCGTINIYGGTIEATPPSGAAGIGCGLVNAANINAGTVNIYGGTVTATAQDGAGIGSGQVDNSDNYTPPTINISGGTVNATGNYGAGIGGGNGGAGGTITITGGNITATSNLGCGIGYGKGADGKGATIKLGWTKFTDKITAKGNDGRNYKAFGKNSTITLTKDFMYGNSPAVAGGNVQTNSDVTIVPAVKITFDANGGSGSMNEVMTAYGNSYTLPECSFTAPNGKTFDKWLVGNIEYAIGASFEVTADTVVKAIWKDTSKTVTFDANGHGTAPEAQSVNENTKATKPTDPTADGYTFEGWYKEAACTNAWNFDSDTVTADITLYAKWTLKTFTITYALDGGTNNEANPAFYDITSPDITLQAPTKENYDFDKWTKDGEAITEISSGSTGDITLTAHWKVKQFTLTFVTGGGTVINPITQDYDSDVTAPADPERNGYTFKGWDKKIPAKMPAENQTFTAQWEAKNYKISYVLNGGDNHPDNPTSYTIESHKITLKNPTRENYDFLNWNCEGTATNQINTGSTGDKTFTAVWKEKKPELSASSTSLNVYKGSSASVTVTAVGVNLTWKISGDLPAGLSGNDSENKYLISGTVSSTAESKTYKFAVIAENPGGKTSKEISITVSNPPSAPDPGTGGGSGDDTTQPDPEPEPETDITPSQEQADELVNNMNNTVANSEAGQATTEVLKSSDPETQSAAVDVVNSLNNSLTPEEIAQLKPEEIQAAVNNKAEEVKDAEKESQSGTVEDTTKPAGTDILKNSSTASEALKTANEKLSVQPKVVTPEPASKQETEETAQKLSGLTESQVDDKDVDLDTVKAASENLKSAEDIKIDTANGDLDAQAEKLEEIFDEVGGNLATAENSSGSQGVVIASVLPTMAPNATGFFKLKINLRNLTPGRKLNFWPSVEYFNSHASRGKTSAKLSGISLADSTGQEGDAFFLDSEGNPVTKITGNAADMSVVPYLEAGKNYSTAFITADATENDLEALNTLASETENSKDSNDGGSSTGGNGSGGGCNLIRSEELGIRNVLIFLLMYGVIFMRGKIFAKK